MILKSIIMGQGNGPIIIILHGLFGESKNWVSIANLLESTYEVHLIDQRNHGNSFHDIEHNYFVLAQDLNHYINSLKLINYSIIGHSMGGKVAMQFALLYPDQIHKLIIIDISPKKYKNQYFSIFKGLEHVLSEAKSRKEAINILINYIDDMVVVNFLLKGLSFDKDNSASLKFNTNALQKNIDNMLDSINSPNTFSRLTYFLKGGMSIHMKKEDIDYISTLFPNNKIIEIENAGHWIHFDQKEIFLKTINTILN